MLVRLAPGFLLMQDNARPHVAGVCQQFLQDEGIDAMDWPACSPDLNPIEHIWDIMSRSIHQRHVAPQTVQELADALVQVWEEIPQETIRHLIRSMPRRQSQMIGPPHPIVARVGDDVILPCHLEPAADVSAEILEWKRHDLKPEFVFVLRSGQDLQNVKNPSYRGRTSVFMDELKHGNLSLKLSKVQLSDQGTYECDLPLLRKRSSVKFMIETKRSHMDETDTGEKRKHYETEDEREREQLTTDETVQMKQLQEEQQRREEAEKRAKNLKKELETKKKEVELKRAELQQLHEEKQKNENDLQNLKEELENKNKEVHVFIFITNRETTQDTNMKDIRQMFDEEHQRRKEAENKVQILKEELQLKISELKGNRDDTKMLLLQETQKKQKAQREVDYLKNLLESGDNGILSYYNVPPYPHIY
ncbi:hypothetical protein L3Q82_003829 [Scortum barcoo]|uniref:Uncharacterized protein n=1 Tax=Scortum barcoo TaxID=214431 RepID=A0ACB8X5E9_9TELE|nr:hypothetical protein L3Q82_003829 [Scortum barcoo]